MAGAETGCDAEKSVTTQGFTTRPNASRSGRHFATRGPSSSITVRSFGPGRSTAMLRCAAFAFATARAVSTMWSQAASSSWAAFTRRTFMPAERSRSTQASVTSAAEGAVTITET